MVYIIPAEQPRPQPRIFEFLSKFMGYGDFSQRAIAKLQHLTLTLTTTCQHIKKASSKRRKIMSLKIYDCPPIHSHHCNGRTTPKMLVGWR